MSVESAGLVIAWKHVVGGVLSLIGMLGLSLKFIWKKNEKAVGKNTKTVEDLKDSLHQDYYKKQEVDQRIDLKLTPLEAALRLNTESNKELSKGVQELTVSIAVIKARADVQKGN